MDVTGNSDQKRSVTFVISSLGGGGAEGVCVSVVNGLADLGWSVNLIVLSMRRSVYHERLSRKVDLVVLGVGHARYAFLPLFRCIKKFNANRVVVFNYELAIVLQLIKTFSKLNFYLIARNINTISKKMELRCSSLKQFLFKFLMRTFYVKVDCVVNQCVDMDVDLIAFSPALKHKTRVIYNPVNEIVLKYARKPRFFKSKKRGYLLCVGRLEKQKSLHVAIEVFARLRGRHPLLRLKILGKGGLEGSLREYASRLHVEDWVDFEGFQKDTIPYYLYANATLLTSLYEGFPNVLVESITLGTPVVAFDCKSGPSEIIVNDVNGRLVDAGDVENMVESVDYIVRNPIERMLVRSTAKKYQIDVIVSQWDRLLGSY